MSRKYSSEYFFERLKQIRQILRTLKSYKTLNEIMQSKEITPEISRVNIHQGLEK